MKSIASTILSIIVIVYTFTSCKDNSQTGYQQWQSERDSINSVNIQLQTMLEQMTGTVAEISMSLDSITQLESMIFRGWNQEGNRMSKKSLKGKLQTLSQLISHQRERIAAMDSTLTGDEQTVSQLKSILSFLNLTLQKKDKEIIRLKKEIDKKELDISQLTEQVAALQDTVHVVQQENEQQKEIIDQQDVTLNEVFFTIGKKDELIRYGIIQKSGKIFKKTKIDFSTINKSALIKADKRELKVIHINGKSPKILSEIPKNAYTLTTEGEHSVLTITNSDAFWSGNNRVLIIQIK